MTPVESVVAPAGATLHRNEKIPHRTVNSRGHVAERGDPGERTAQRGQRKEKRPPDGGLFSL